MSDPPRLHRSGDDTPSASAPPLSSSRLLRSIEETSDLLRSFRTLKERGATREELAALHTRVRLLKEAQVRAAYDAPAAPALAVSSTGQSQRSNAVDGVLTRDGAVAGLNTSSAPHGSHHHAHRHQQQQQQQQPAAASVSQQPPTHPSLPAHHVDPAVPVAQRIPPPPPSSSSASRPSDYRRTPQSLPLAPQATASTPLLSSTTAAASVMPSVVFAIVLAESHTRREVAHKWERRLLRLWAAFREERVAIALRPTTGQQWLPIRGDDEGGRSSAHAAYAQGLAPQLLQERGRQGQSTAISAVDASPLAGAMAAVSAPVTSSHGSQDKESTQQAFTAQQFGGGPDVSSPSSFSSCAPPVPGTLSPDGQHAGALMRGATKPPPTVFDIPAPQPVLASPGPGQGGRHAPLPVPTPPAFTPAPTRTDEALLEAQRVERERKEREAAVAAESERARRQREEEEEAAAAERQEARRREEEAAAVRAAAACDGHLQQERADRHAVTESEGIAWRSLRDAARSSLRAAVEAAAAREEEAARQQRAKDAAAARQQLTEGEHAARQRTSDEEDASRALLQHSEAEGRAAARARTEERRRVEAEAERAAAAESERQRRAAAEKEKEKEAARERELEAEKTARERKAREEAEEEEQMKVARALHSEKASLTRQLQDVTDTLLTALVKEAVLAVGARAAAEEQKAKEEAEAKARQEREEEEERQRAAAAAAKEAEEEVAAQARRDVEAAEEGSRLLVVVDEETAHEQLERVAEASKAAAAAAAAAAMKRKAAEEEKAAQAKAQEEEQRAAAAAASAAAASAASQQQLKQERVALLEGVCRTLLDEVVRDAAEAVEEKRRAAAAQAAADAAEEKRLREEEERKKQKEEERRRAEAQREEEAAAAAASVAAAAAAAAQKRNEDEEKEREATRHAAEAAARLQQERQRAAAVAEHCALLATAAASLADEWIAESAEAVTAQAAQFSADVMRLCDSEDSARAELVTAALAAATALASQHEQEISALRCIAEEAAALPESHGEKDHALLVEASNPDSSTTAQTNAKAGATAKTVESSSSSSSSSDATASVPSSASFLPTPDAATPSLVQSRATPDSFLHVADGFLADLLHDAAVEATESMFQQLPEKERGHAEELEGSEMRTPRRGMVKLLDAVLTDQDTAKRVSEEGETEAAAGGGRGEEGGVGRGSPESASTMPSPSERTCTSNASSPCSVPPRAEPPAPLTPHAAVAAAAAAAASAKPRKASPLSEKAEAAAVTPQAAEDRHQQEEKETRGREGSVGDHAATADPVSSPAREGGDEDHTTTLCEGPLLQPDQQRSFQAPSDSLRAVTTMPTAFSASPPRSLSSSTPSGHHDEEETPNAAVRGVRQPLNLTPPPDRDLSPLLANAVDSPNSHAQAQQHEQQPVNSASAEPQDSERLASVSTDKANVNGGVSPPLGPVPAGACAGDGSGAASRRGSAGELDMSASALDEGLRALSLDAPSVPPFRLEAAAPPHSPPEGSQSDLQAALSVEKLEAASASMMQALIHDAVRLLPVKSSYGVAPLTTAIATTPPRDLERFDAHVGERHLSPSLSSERLHSLSPSHSDSMHPPSPTHLTATVAAAGGLTAATGSSSSSSGAATPPPATAHASAGVVSATHSGGDGLSVHGEGSEKHTDRRHSISELGHGFTRSDAQEALPLSPSSSPTAPPSLPSPAAAAAAVVATAGASKSGSAHEARMDLASLSTLVTAVATPNDFIAQLRQQEAAKRAAAHLQNRYLTPRELAAEAADFLTSPVAAALVTDVGPVEALTTRAVALVLAMGLVRRVTLANRRARRRVERAKAAAAASPTQPDEHQQQQTKNGSSPKSAGEGREGNATAAATMEDDAVARAGGFDAIHSPCDNPEEAFPTGAVHTDVEDEEEEGMIAPASPSLGGRHGTHDFGAAVGAADSDAGSFPSGFPTTSGPSASAEGSGDHQGSEDDDAEDDPYSSAAVAPSVMSPSAHFPSFASSTAAAATAAKRAGPLLSPPVDSISAEGAAADTSKGEDGEDGRTLPGQESAAKLPVEWDAALRAVAERIAGDLMDYASRRLLLGQGEGQSNQDHLRTAEKLHEDAVAAVDVSLLFTRELRLRDVARLTLYYLELAANGTRDRTDPHYAPTALGEHNMFGRRSSGDNDGEEEEKGSSSWVMAVGAHDGEGSRAAGSSSALCAPAGSSSSTLFSPRLHPHNDTFLTAATAIHVRRSGLMQLVLEQCIANVMDDLVGDTVGWLGTSYLPACAAAAAAPTPKRRKRSS